MLITPKKKISETALNKWIVGVTLLRYFKRDLSCEQRPRVLSTNTQHLQAIDK